MEQRKEGPVIWFSQHWALAGIGLLGVSIAERPLPAAVPILCRLFMAFDPALAQRVRDVFSDRTDITERQMFGGLAFLIDGKMFIGIRNSSLMARD